MQTIIKLDGISARYDKENVLEGVSLEVKAHDYLGIIGPNGGGKTTLMRIILGLKKPTGGRIAYYRDGMAVDKLAMGYLPQYNQIDRQFPISVYEVVLSGLDGGRQLLRRYSQEQHEQVRQTLRRMELEPLAERPIGALSGGQLQRVLLSRAIVGRPEVLILDEPNTYIDKRFEEQLYETLEDINRDCAIIIVSHDIATILDNVKHVACVNRTLHYHKTADMPREKLEKHFLSI